MLTSDRAEMIARIAAEPSAVGFAGMADAVNSQEREQVKLVKLVFDDAEPEAERLQVRGQTAYAISRPLFFFARAPLSPAVKRFVEFVLSPRGQSLIVASNFFPIHPAPDPGGR